MASFEMLAMDEEDEPTAKRFRVVAQEVENQGEESETDSDQDQESESLPDSDEYDMLSDEGEDVQKPEGAQTETEEGTSDGKNVVDISRRMKNFVEGKHAERPLHPKWRRGSEWIPNPYIKFSETDLTTNVNDIIAENENFVWIEGRMYDGKLAYPYDHRKNNLWPKLIQAIQEIKIEQGDNLEEIESVNMDIELLEEYESAIEFLIEKKRPSGNCTTEKEKEELLEYKKSRQQHIQFLASEFNLNHFRRPGHHHEFAKLFPVHMSYDMIEYLSVAILYSNFPLSSLESEGTDSAPEFFEVTDKTREIIEQCFLLDTSLTKELLSATDKKAKFENSDETYVIEIYEEMNTTFNFDFEHYVIGTAAYIREITGTSNDENQKTVDPTPQAKAVAAAPPPPPPAVLPVNQELARNTVEQPNTDALLAKHSECTCDHM